MKKILLTGATDGIGLETAKMLAARGHHLLLHGRNPEKLARTVEILATIRGAGKMETFTADLSRLADVKAFAQAIADKHSSLDVLINNAGVLKSPENTTVDGFDIRFVVNTFAPYLLAKRLLPLFSSSGRILNLSSAAQSPVNLDALTADGGQLGDGAAYAQSKLAITMWSFQLARQLGTAGPAVIAVNPGSLLASKMVKEAYGVAGADLSIGARILTRLALDEEYANASGQYFDNDSGNFAAPHRDALDRHKTDELVRILDDLLADYLQDGV